jgi:drug/metabolite transporter (DMT)-like permease
MLFYAVTQGASFVALAFLPAVTVNLLWSFSAVLVALLGMSFLRERMTTIQWVGILLSVLGALIYFYPVSFPENSGAGLLAAALGVAANAVASILGRDINRSGDLDPLSVTVVSMGTGSVVLLMTGILTQGLPTLSMQSWAIIGWLAVVNTAIAFTLWNRTLQTLQATESSVINGTMMIWIPILAVLFLGETLTLKGILGLIAAGVGTLIVQVRRPFEQIKQFNKREERG